jgi:hypothetical protein
MKVTSMRGKVIDMSRYVAQNEHKIALGNASMNARGDIVGRGGAIVKKREVQAQEYHSSNPRAVKTVGLSNIMGEVLSPVEGKKVLDSMRKAAAADVAKPQRKIIDSE